MTRRRGRLARAADVVVGTVAHYGALTAVFVGAACLITKNIVVARLRRDEP